jgi:hypothetical protein
MTNSDSEVIEATLVQRPAARSTEPEAGRHGFSLASLFVLTTAVAVLVSGFAPVAQFVIAGELGFAPLAIALALGVLAGLLIGLVLGMHAFNRAWGAFVGGSVGAGIGLLVGPMALLPERLLRPVGVAMLTGSILMILIAFLMRPGRR